MTLSNERVIYNVTGISFIKMVYLEALELFHSTEIIQILCLDVLITERLFKSLEMSKV